MGSFDTDPHHGMTGEVFLDVQKVGPYQLVIYKWSYNSIGEITPVSMASYPWYFRPFIGTPLTGPFMKKTSGNGHLRNEGDSQSHPNQVPDLRFFQGTPRSPSDSGGRPGFPQLGIPMILRGFLLWETRMSDLTTKFHQLVHWLFAMKHV